MDDAKSSSVVVWDVLTSADAFLITGLGQRKLIDACDLAARTSGAHANLRLAVEDIRRLAMPHKRPAGGMAGMMARYHEMVAEVMPSRSHPLNEAQWESLSQACDSLRRIVAGEPAVQTEPTPPEPKTAKTGEEQATDETNSEPTPHELLCQAMYDVAREKLGETSTYKEHWTWFEKRDDIRDQLPASIDAYKKAVNRANSKTGRNVLASRQK